MYALSTHCSSAGVEPEVPPDGRQRDRDDRDVEDDDELRDAEEREAEAARAGRSLFRPAPRSEALRPLLPLFMLLVVTDVALRVNSGLVVTRTIETIEFWGGDLALDFANTVEGGTRARIDHLRDYGGPRDLDAAGRRAARERAAGGRPRRPPASCATRSTACSTRWPPGGTPPPPAR